MSRPPLLLALLLVLLAALPLACEESREPAAPVVDEPPPPATQPAARPAVESEPVPATYLDLVREGRPNLEEAEPRPGAVTFEEATKVRLDQPTFLDAVGNLWITDARGRDAAEVVADVDSHADQAFVVTEPVAFAWWRTEADGGGLELIVRRDDGGHDWLHRFGRVGVPEGEPEGEYDFARAWAWDGRLVVPTRGGAAVLTPAGRPADPEQYARRYARLPADRRPDAAGTVEVEAVTITDQADQVDPPPTQVRGDGVGLLAWVPWDDGPDAPGGDLVARFAGGAWAALDPADGWSTRPVHLMPLADGAVLQLGLDADGSFDLRTIPLNDIGVPREAIEAAVANLTNPSRPVRDAAYAALVEAGASAWPTLEELLPTARGRARGDIAEVLAARDRPTVGGLFPEPGPVTVRSRLGDGGVILEFDGGVSVPDVAGVRVLRRPGYVLVRPGRRVGPVADALEAVLQDGSASVAVHGDEVVITRRDGPPERYGFNHLAPILGEDPPAGAEGHAAFAGIDARGRWLFRRDDSDAGALVVDTRLPDPTPALPTWVVETGELGEAGWDDEDWPVMKLGGAWRLLEETWEPLPPETPVHTRQAKSGMWELARGVNGESYYGGLTDLRVVHPDGREVTWPLPPEATGVLDRESVKLAADAQGRVFLFNRPGRVVRIEPTADGADGADSASGPYEVVGVFDEEIPNAVPRRAWVDPAGRVCASYFGDTVAIMWPDGQVPPAIRQLMPAKRREGTTQFEGA